MLYFLVSFEELLVLGVDLLDFLGKTCDGRLDYRELQDLLYVGSLYRVFEQKAVDEVFQLGGVLARDFFLFGWRLA